MYTNIFTLKNLTFYENLKFRIRLNKFQITLPLEIANCMKLLIGIDDTDNKESRGTGFKTRQLAKLIEDKKLGLVKGITRHQLFVHPNIAYTSQNSSACIEVESEFYNELIVFCSDFLSTESAPGSDAGLCIAGWEAVTEKIQNWGEKTKVEVLTLEEASRLSDENGIFLCGLTGTKIGQIGALAAVGLRKTGNDGRFIWLKGSGELRDFDSGTYTVLALKQKAGIQDVKDLNLHDIPENEVVLCDGWTRPVLLNNNAVLFVEKTNFAQHEWKTVTKEYIRSIT